RAGRYPGPLLHDRHLQDVHGTGGGQPGRAGDRLDADIPADGRRAVFPPVRPVPGRRALRAALRATSGGAAGRHTAVVLLVLLAAVPAVANAADLGFVTSLATRIMIYAIAALSLDLILGYGAMVSFGHAAFVGIGAYAVGIASAHDVWD